MPKHTVQRTIDQQSSRVAASQSNSMVIVSGQGVGGTTGGGSGAGQFIDLADVPSSYAGNAGLSAVVNGAETGLVFQTAEASFGTVSAVGQVLISVDGSTMSIQQPLIGEGGWLVDEVSGVLLVSTSS